MVVVWRWLGADVARSNLLSHAEPLPIVRLDLIFEHWLPNIEASLHGPDTRFGSLLSLTIVPGGPQGLVTMLPFHNSLMKI